ncbi:hypothetical protein [Streptomyces sp. NPDC051567]|uniref:hypothetical protein n=1 Tax=Streptomyces sp. NPDC051567 TaxID=3365660 RepID=UPI003787479E
MTGPAPTTESGPPPAARPAPWVRTRLRATPLSALLAAALAFVTVLLAASLPRALDRGADQALRSFLDRQGPAATSLLATASAESGTMTPKELDTVLAVLRDRVAQDFTLAADGPVHGSQSNKARDLTDPGVVRIEDVPSRLGLVHLPQAAAHTTLVAGRLPGATTPGGPVPVMLSQAVAQSLGIRLGTVLNTPSGTSGTPRAEVVGLYTATDETSTFWTGLPCLTRVCQSRTTTVPPKSYWQAAALVGAESLDQLDPWGSGAEDFWRLPVDTTVLRADQLQGDAKKTAAYVAGPTGSALVRATGRTDLRVSSRLPALFTQAQTRQQAAAPLAAIGPAGVAGVALVVFCLAAALTGDRRAAELRLLRARGGSRGGIVRRLLGENLVTTLPAAALATATAVLLLPTPRLAATVSAASAATLLALLAFPVRAAVLLSAPRGPAARRRLVGELLVLAATTAAILETRRRGVAPAGAGVDPLLVAAPLLLALCGGLLLARVQPLLVGAFARTARRGTGLIGFLGLARASRGTGGKARPSVLPLVALLLAVTTAGFGATVLASVDATRLQVARQTVGGDARITVATGAPVPEPLTKAAAALPGVRRALTVWTDDDATLVGVSGRSARVTVVVAEPRAYAELARTAGRGLFDPALLTGDVPGGDAPVPALVSADLAGGTSGDGTHRIRFGNGKELRAKAAATVEATPVLPGYKAGFVVLPAGPATARIPQAAHPSHWFATGEIDDARLRDLVQEAAPAGATDHYRVRTSAGTATELAADPLQRSAARLFWAAVAGAGGFALLAVLLGLVRAAPDRAALLARLRTMGLRPRQGFLLILAESLPQALAAALGGGLTAVAAVALLGPAVDLSALVGAVVPAGLRLTAEPVLTQALGLAALAAVAVLAEAAVSGRRQITTELRAGDH